MWGANRGSTPLYITIEIPHIRLPKSLTSPRVWSRLLFRHSAIPPSEQVGFPTFAFRPAHQSLVEEYLPKLLDGRWIQQLKRVIPFMICSSSDKVIPIATPCTGAGPPWWLDGKAYFTLDKPHRHEVGKESSPRHTLLLMAIGLVSANIMTRNVHPRSMDRHTRRNPGGCQPHQSDQPFC